MPVKAVTAPPAIDVVVRGVDVVQILEILPTPDGLRVADKRQLVVADVQLDLGTVVGGLAVTRMELLLMVVKIGEIVAIDLAIIWLRDRHIWRVFQDPTAFEIIRQIHSGIPSTFRLCIIGRHIDFQMKDEGFQRLLGGGRMIFDGSGVRGVATETPKFLLTIIIFFFIFSGRLSVTGLLLSSLSSVVVGFH
jgi:hypothetical protein